MTEATLPIRRQGLTALSQQLPLICTAFVCAALYAVASFRYPGFFAPQVFFDFFGNSAFLGCAAIGLTFVILSGGIDLSVGSMIGLTSILTGILIEKLHWHPALAIPAVLLFGAAFGFISGCIIHFFELAPFLVTLAGMFVARGLALTIAPRGEQRISMLHPLFDWTSNHSIAIGHAQIRLIAVILIALAVLTALVLRYTRFGRNVYAIGGNEQSALLMGLEVGRTKILVYTISGLCSALGGLVFCVDLLAADATAGMGLELDAIAAVVIGGTLLSGGVGSIAGTILGILILAIIQTALNFEGTLSSWWSKIAIGGLLLAFVALQKLLTTATRRT